MTDKMILVIDTPKSCADCRLKRGLFCGANGNSLYDYIHNGDSINDKPSWCPLRSLPKKRDTRIFYFEDEDTDYRAVGFNDCLALITGETE